MRGRDRAAIRAVWPLSVQQLVVSRLRTASIWSDGDQVRVNVWGLVVDPHRLEAMVDVVGALASAGADEFRALAQPSGATLVHSPGTWNRPSAPRLTFETPQGTATASLRWVKSNPRVWLVLPTSREIPQFRVVVRGGHADGLPSGLLGESTQRWLDALDGVLLLSEPGKLHVRWLGIPTLDGLAAGLKVMAELAEGRHHVGVFR